MRELCTRNVNLIRLRLHLNQFIFFKKKKLYLCFQDKYINNNKKMILFIRLLNDK